MQNQPWTTYNPDKIMPCDLTDIECLHFDISNVCNTRSLGGICPLCPPQYSSARKKGILKKDIFSRLVDDLAGRVHSFSLVGHGEPTMHPDIWELCGYAEVNDVRIVVGSNGNNLSGANLSKFIKSRISLLELPLDGLDAKSHEFIRPGVPFEPLMLTLKTLARLKKNLEIDTVIRIQTLATSANEKQLDQIKAFADECGFEHRVQRLSYGHGLIPNREQLIAKYRPSNPDLQRPSEKRTFLESYINHYISSCPFATSAFILSDGIVSKCCYTMGHELPIGDLNTACFSDIWFGKEHEELLKNVHKAEVDFCNHCYCGRTYKRKDSREDGE